MRYAGIIAVATITMLLGLSVAVSRQVPSSLGDMQRSFAPVVQAASPSVVNIYTTRRVKVRSGISPLFQDPFFRQFLPPANRIQEQTVNSLGSGVIISEQGIIITSLHVVNQAEDIRIVLHDRTELNARIILEDTASDLALLQIETPSASLPAIPISDSNALQVGDLVLAIGNPFGVGQTVTSGIVSGLARTASGINDYSFFIQTDAAINPGNSGGALVDMHGQLVGINTAIYSRSGGSNGIGFAIPSNMVRALLSNRNDNGQFQRPWIGGQYTDMTSEMAASLGMKRPQGVLITRIYQDSPAERAGLQESDIITAFQEHPIDTAAALTFHVSTAPINTASSISYQRQGKQFNTMIRLTPKPELNDNDPVILEGRHPLNGVSVIALTPLNRAALGISSSDTGVAIIALPKRSGRGFVREKDIITHCNGRVIRTMTDLQQALDVGGRAMSLTLLRDNQTLQLKVVQ